MKDGEHCHWNIPANRMYFKDLKGPSDTRNMERNDDVVTFIKTRGNILW